MSSGPIAHARYGSTSTAPRKCPKAGTIVQPDQHPPGFPLWRVAPGSQPSTSRDVVILHALTSACPVQRISRWAGTLSIDKERP